MPVYEYRCTACGAPSEELRPMARSNADPGPCPACGGRRRRAFGRVGVRFEGWGFSRTDALVSEDRPRKDFKALRERAEQLRDG